MFGMYGHPAMLGPMRPMPAPANDDRWVRRDELGPMQRMPPFDAPPLSRRRSRSNSQDRRLRDRSPPKRVRGRSRSRSLDAVPKKRPEISPPRHLRSRSRSHGRKSAERPDEKRQKGLFGPIRPDRPSPPRQEPLPGRKRVLSQFEDPSQREEPHTPLATPPRRNAGEEPFKVTSDPLDYLKDPLAAPAVSSNSTVLTYPPPRHDEEPLPAIGRGPLPQPPAGPPQPGWAPPPVQEPQVPSPNDASAPLQAFRLPKPPPSNPVDSWSMDKPKERLKVRKDPQSEEEDEDYGGNQPHGRSPSRSQSGDESSQASNQKEDYELKPIRRPPAPLPLRDEPEDQFSGDEPNQPSRQSWDRAQPPSTSEPSSMKVISIIPIIGNLPTRPSGGLPPPRRCISALQVLLALCQGLTQEVPLEQQLAFTKHRAQEESVPTAEMLYAVDRMWRSLQDKHGIKRGHNYVLRPGNMAEQILSAVQQELESLLGPSKNPKAVATDYESPQLKPTPLLQPMSQPPPQGYPDMMPHAGAPPPHMTDVAHLRAAAMGPTYDVPGQLAALAPPAMSHDQMHREQVPMPAYHPMPYEDPALRALRPMQPDMRFASQPLPPAGPYWEGAPPQDNRFPVRGPEPDDFVKRPLRPDEGFPMHLQPNQPWASMPPQPNQYWMPHPS